MSLRQRFTPGARVPADARRLLRGWLERHRWPATGIDDLLFVASEALSNAVEHAYDAPETGPITLRADLERDGDTRRVTLTVTDSGSWRPPPADPGHRGRGLSMIEAMVEHLTIERLPSGTHLRMTSLPVPRVTSRSTGHPSPAH